MLSINLETATNEELNAAQLLISDALGRRQTLAEAARSIHRLTVAYQDAAGRVEGEEWSHPGTVGFPEGWSTWHKGKMWISTVDNNVWEPGVSGWHSAPDENGVSLWVQPTGAHDAYTEGDLVYWPDGVVWRNTHPGERTNTWEPGVYGWTRENE